MAAGIRSRSKRCSQPDIRIRWPVIGSQEDLTAASLADVQEFFRRYYTPNNLSLVIAGDFDPAEAKRLVEKYFGVIPPGPRSIVPRAGCR